MQSNAQINSEDPVIQQTARQNPMHAQINIQNNEYKTIHNFILVNQEIDRNTGDQSDNERQNPNEHANSINQSQLDEMEDNIENSRPRNIHSPTDDFFYKD